MPPKDKKRSKWEGEEEPAENDAPMNAQSEEQMPETKNRQKERKRAAKKERNVSDEQTAESPATGEANAEDNVNLRILADLTENIQKLEEKLAELDQGQGSARNRAAIASILQKMRRQKSELEEAIKPKSSSFLDNYCILMFLIVVFGLMCFSKMNEEFYTRFAWSNQVNFYDVLDLTPGASNQEIKAKYRELAMKWHPDKNPDCADCTKRFAEIQNAYETLGDKQRRQAYDESNGVLNFIKSATVELTKDNFDKTVTQTGDLWFIQVYENGFPSCEHFGIYWEELHKKYPFLKLGRVNYKSQKEVLRKLPFGINELPFVMRVGGGLDSEFLNLKAFQDQGKQLHKFVETAFKTDFTERPSESERHWVQLTLKAPLQGKIELAHYSQTFERWFGVKTFVTVDRTLKESSVTVNIGEQKRKFEIKLAPKLFFDALLHYVFYASPRLKISREAYREFCMEETRCLFIGDKVSKNWKGNAREELMKTAEEFLTQEVSFDTRKVTFDFDWEITHHPLLASVIKKGVDFVLTNPISESLAQLTISDLQAIEDCEDVESDRFVRYNELFGKRIDLWQQLRPSGYSFPIYAFKTLIWNICSFSLLNLIFLTLYVLLRKRFANFKRILLPLYLFAALAITYSDLKAMYG